MRPYTEETKKDVTSIFFKGYFQLKSVIEPEKALYDQYKNSNLTFIDPTMKMGFETLEMLENLGFPMDETGTYFFRDLVVRVMTLLNMDLADRETIEAELENPFSQLYFDIARNDLDLGIKSFLKYIEMAFSRIDIRNADPEFLETIVEAMDTAVSNNQLPLILAENSRSLDLGQTRVRALYDADLDEEEAN